MKKKLFISFIFIFLLFAIVGCGDPYKDYDMVKINSINDNISCMEDVGEDDYDFVFETYEMYNSLKEEEKLLINNVEILEEAFNTVSFYHNLNNLLESEFDNIYKYIDNNVPSTILSVIDSITLPLSYSFLAQGSSYNYKISWSSSAPELINVDGTVKHKKQENIVTLTATIKCVKTKVEKTYNKDIIIERGTGKVFDKQICVAYWYGGYSDLTETDLNTIDVINWSFAQIAKNEAGEWYISGRLNRLAEFQKMREQGKKVCLSLGGWHDDKSFWNTYAEAAKTDASRKAVAQAILDTLIEYNLDGVDMDWEYPASKDRTNYTLLMKQIRETLKAYNEDYLVTAAIPAGSWIGSQFDIKGLNDCLDYFYVMSYDMDDGMNCNHLSSLQDAIDAVQWYNKNGADLDKIVIGSAFYGRIYEGASDANNGLGSMAKNKYETSYDDIKENYLSRIGNGVSKLYDNDAKAYYLYDKQNHIYITYEDKESVIEKWEYVVSSKIGGLMFWSYNEDRTNTLVKAINDAMNN